MERALVVGGLTTATGLYVGTVAVRYSYDLLNRGLDYITRQFTAPWSESEPRMAVPSGISNMMLLARDAQGGTMLLTHTGVFYLAAPSYDLYEFCAPAVVGVAKPQPKIHIRLSVDAFLLYHSALACLYHQSSLPMLMDELRTRTNAFVADALLHMLCNDFAKLLATKPILPAPLSAAIATLLHALCDDDNKDARHGSSSSSPAAAARSHPKKKPSMWRRFMIFMLGDDKDEEEETSSATKARSSIDLIRAFISNTEAWNAFHHQAVAPNGFYYYAPMPTDAALSTQRLGVTLRHTELSQLGVYVQWDPPSVPTFERNNARHLLVNDVAVRVGRLRYGLLLSS